MSSMPNPQLDGLLAGGQLLGQAASNQNIGFQKQAQERASALEARGQDLQNVMHQRGLNAEAENYQKLNASRERMHGMEMAQDRELQMMDKEFMLAIQQVQARSKQKAAEILAAQRGDPRLREFRTQRRALEGQARSLEQALNAARTAKGLAQSVKDTRAQDIQARLLATHESIKMLGDQARTSMGQAFNDAILQNTRDSGGFWGESNRSADEAFNALGAMVPSLNNPVVQGVLRVENVTKTIVENMMDSWFGLGPPRSMVEARMTEPEKSPTAMAGLIVHHAFTKYDDAFGLKGDQKAAAEATLMGILGKASALSDAEDFGGKHTGESLDNVRGAIADGIGKLRGYGMQDAQILAVFDSLEGFAENSSEMIMEQGLATSGIQGGKGAILEKTLTGLGSIADAVQATFTDRELMKRRAGGELVDHEKFDMPGVYQKAMAAYAMDRNSAQMQEFTGELGRLGVRDPKQIEGLVTKLIEADPELQNMGFNIDPKEITNMILQMEQQGTRYAQQGKALTEEEMLEMQAYQGAGESQVAQEEVQALDALMADFKARRDR